jgi:co-chaperonin GroES (HSP10)
MVLRRDLCLVKLAPGADRTPSGVLLAHTVTPTVCYGKVVNIGRDVEAYGVSLGDVVAFGPTQGESVDGMFPTPHILIPVTAIDAVIPKKDVAA